MAAKKRARTRRQSAAPRVENLKFVVEADPGSTPEDYLFQDPEYKEQDQERLDAFNRGDWSMVGVRAEVEVAIAGTVQTIRTPGVWAVESDSSQSYFNELGTQEYAELLVILAEMGIPKNRVPKASTGRWVER
jgi:hypothetical protein